MCELYDELDFREAPVSGAKFPGGAGRGLRSQSRCAPMRWCAHALVSPHCKPIDGGCGPPGLQPARWVPRAVAGASVRHAMSIILMGVAWGDSHNVVALCTYMALKCCKMRYGDSDHTSQEMRSV